MSGSDRVTRALAFAVCLALVAFILLVFWLLPTAGEPRPAQLYAGIPLDAHLLALDKRALEEAYLAHATKLWGVWLADGGRDSGPISRGLANNRRAYGLAAEQIERREREASP